MLANCVECRKPFDIPDPHPGDIVSCPSCNISMRVLSINVNRIYLETVDQELEDAEEEVETP